MLPTYGYAILMYIRGPYGVFNEYSNLKIVIFDISNSNLDVILRKCFGNYQVTYLANYQMKYQVKYQIKYLLKYLMKYLMSY